jgi:hypothetical protein
LDRGRLPTPDDFYRHNVQHYRRFGRKARGICPFHQSSHRSTPLSIDLDRGLFNCFVCGRGGDILSFVQLRDNVSFKQAAEILGAWRTKPLTARERFDLTRQEQKHKQLELAAERYFDHERNLRSACRDQLHFIETLQRQNDAWLDDAATDSERESFWLTASLLCDAQRNAAAGYALLSFGAMKERVDFVMHPEQRLNVIAEILNRGFVRDDEGRMVEVAL